MRLQQHVAASILALLSLVSLSSAWALPSYPGNVARVNDIDVSYQRFMGVYNEHVRDNGIAIGARGDQLELLTRLRKEALDLLIKQELLIQASSSAGMKALPRGAVGPVRRPQDPAGGSRSRPSAAAANKEGPVS